MELYFKGDQNSALSIRHISYLLQSKKRGFEGLLDESFMNDLKSQFENDENSTHAISSISYLQQELNDSYINDTLEPIAGSIKELSIDGVAPSKDVIYAKLQKLNSQLNEETRQLLQDVIENFGVIQEAVSNSSIRGKAKTLDKLQEMFGQTAGFIQSLLAISLVELYKDSGAHRNNKLDELENTKALSQWINLLKLSPTLNNFIKAKEEFLYKLAEVHYTSIAESGGSVSEYQYEYAKNSFIKDAMHKLYEEYSMSLVHQVLTNIMASEDRDLAVKQLSEIIQNALIRKEDFLKEVFDDAIHG